MLITMSPLNNLVLEGRHEGKILLPVVQNKRSTSTIPQRRRQMDKLSSPIYLNGMNRNITLRLRIILNSINKRIKLDVETVAPTVGETVILPMHTLKINTCLLHLLSLNLNKCHSKDFTLHYILSRCRLDSLSIAHILYHIFHQIPCLDTLNLHTPHRFTTIILVLVFNLSLCLLSMKK
jgi:hypothetical protein